MNYDSNFTWGNHYEQLMSFLPGYYRGNKEMEAIMSVSGTLHDTLRENLEYVLDQAFIDTASEETISKDEILLGLVLHKSRSLEERRRRLKAFVSGTEKAGADSLRSIIYAYTGTTADIRLEPYDSEGNNRLYIDIPRGTEGTIYADDLSLLIGRKIPAHIEYRPEITYVYSVVCGYHRTHYLFDYPLTGLKPDIATLGSYGKYPTVTSRKSRNYKTDYPQSSETGLTGKYPDDATLGLYGSYPTAVSASREHYTTDYPASSEDGETGILPSDATLGSVTDASTAAAVKVENFSIDYPLCGDDYAQS